MTEIIAGVVLAAGRSERVGTPKALAELDGQTFAARAVRALSEGGCSQVWVVVGAPWAARIAAAVVGARIVENPEPDRGMMSSLQVGLAAALQSEPPPTAVVFSLVDHPRVGAAVVRRLIAEPRAEDEALRPSYAGRAGHPVLLGARVARSLMGVDDRTIVRVAIAKFARWRAVEIDDDSILDDTNTRESIRALGADPSDE